MAETKFTPGPWVVSGGFDEYGSVPITKADGTGGGLRCFVEAPCAYDAPENAVAAANAALIAAAPDLYEACACALRDIREGGKVRAEKLIRALMKAGAGQ